MRVDVRVAGSDLPAYKAFQVKLTFDPELLSYVSVEPAANFEGQLCVPPVLEPGLFGFACTLLGSELVEGENLLFSATFRLTSATCAGIHFTSYEEAGTTGSYLVNQHNEPIVVQLNDFEVC